MHAPSRAPLNATLGVSNMSLPMFSITCAQCAFECMFAPFGTPYRYRLDDGSDIHAETSNGWCMKCGGPQNIQAAIVPSEIADRIRQFKDKLSRAVKPRILGLFERRLSHEERFELDDARSQLEWLTKLHQLIGNEVIIARCLKCGTTSVCEFSLPEYGSRSPKPLPFPHPSCGGQLLILEEGRIAVAPRAPVFLKIRNTATEATTRPRQSPTADVDKNGLIKALVRLRIRNDPMARQMGFDEQTVDSLSTIQLASLPEATILTIVETWAILHKRGVSDAEIAARIEEHRARAFPRGPLPSPLDLTSYIKHRLRVEHAQGAPLNEDFADEAIAAAKRAYDA